MAYADITINDRNPVKRWIQRQRFRDALAAIAESRSGDGIDLLDFGGGDGELIRQVLDERPSVRACLYEPTARLREEAEINLGGRSVDIVADLASIRNRRFNYIFCLEVFEHLPKAQSQHALADIHSLLKPGGVAVIGVPHEVLLPALAKGLFRMTRRFGAFDARPENVLRAALGHPPSNRPTKEIAPGFGYHYYHLGFDYREFERSLAKHFRIVSRWFSPARALGPLLNSEVYYLLRSAVD